MIAKGSKPMTETSKEACNDEIAKLEFFQKHNHDILVKERTGKAAALLRALAAERDAALARSKSSEMEIVAILSTPDNDVVRVREGGGAEEICASLAVTMARTRFARDSAIARAESAERQIVLQRIEIERLSSPDPLRKLLARIKTLEEALIGIEEYWNGSRTDGAMSDALDVIVSRARAAREGKTISAAHDGAFETLADALDCFWNAALGAAIDTQDSTATATAGALAQGFAAIARRLREHTNKGEAS